VSKKRTKHVIFAYRLHKNFSSRRSTSSLNDQTNLLERGRRRIAYRYNSDHYAFVKRGQPCWAGSLSSPRAMSVDVRLTTGSSPSPSSGSSHTTYNTSVPCFTRTTRDRFSISICLKLFLFGIWIYSLLLYDLQSSICTARQ
jgi:hypothetical protein